MVIHDFGMNAAHAVGADGREVEDQWRLRTFMPPPKPTLLLSWCVEAHSVLRRPMRRGEGAVRRVRRFRGRVGRHFLVATRH